MLRVIGNRSCIELEGVKTHNLKIDKVRFPLGKITVVTGLSGSGKSSLVFDTLYAEAFRRYVESLSSYARQYIKALPKPELESCYHLPPAIAIRQNGSSGGSGALWQRSTVGTLTEITDLLRVVFTHLGEIYCSECEQTLHKWYPQSVVDDILANHQDQNVLVMAPLDRFHKLESLNPQDLIKQLLAQGFTRVYVDGSKVVKLDEVKSLMPQKTSVIIDRIKVDGKQKGRLFEGIQLAFKAGGNQATILVETPEKIVKKFRSDFKCPSCEKQFQEPSMALLSFNHPIGACPGCQGFGRSSELDWSKIIPHSTSSLAAEGVIPWNFGQFREFYTWAKQSLGAQNKIFEKMFGDYNTEEWRWLKDGKGRSFPGIYGFFKYLESKKYKPHYRMHLARFKKYELCSTCQGTRLSSASLAVKVLDLSLADVHQFKLQELSEWVKNLKYKGTVRQKDQSQRIMGLAEALDDLDSRIESLNRLGLGYLTPHRPGRSISGGELQRIHLGRCLGSALHETLYCLDEPTSGLHPRDSQRLLEVIQELCSNHNTVVMVEHDQAMIEGSDCLVEIGPKAGAEGGKIVFEGSPSDWNRSKVTGQTLLSPREIKTTTRSMTLSHGTLHNLKNVSITFPVGHLTVVCGVSGSGKTSLIEHSLFPALQRVFGDPKTRLQGKAGDEEGPDEEVPEGVATQGQGKLQVEPLSTIKEHRGVMMVSQGALARSSRSTIATYLGMMDDIRKLFAKQPLAKSLGLTPGSFSFNTPGGRCEICKGLGTVVEDLSFLGEVEVICPSCQGRRFNDQVLQVTYKGLNLNQVFMLTVRQARDVFADRPALRTACDGVCELGLGYLTLGQHTSGFSGGEAQRLKLLSMTSETDDLRPMILIFDEPTRGLSQADVQVFLQHLRRLSDQGHTLVVVEHHLDVIRAADWLIEVGPGASDEGGEIVYMGSIDAFIKTKPSRSETLRFLLEIP